MKIGDIRSGYRYYRVCIWGLLSMALIWIVLLFSLIGMADALDNSPNSFITWGGIAMFVVPVLLTLLAWSFKKQMDSYIKQLGEHDRELMEIREDLANLRGILEGKEKANARNK